MSTTRAATFAHLDEARLGWFHIRSILVAGAGFFGDAYDIFVIGLALPMIYRVYYPPADGNKLKGSSFGADHPHIDALLKASTNWGNLVGQLSFGYLGDKLGRKKVYGVEIIIMMVAILGSTLACSTVRGMGVLTMLGLWRFVLGIGIGGDYPMSATITSEFAQVRYRGMMIAAVFAMQGIGILVGGLVTLIALAAFQNLIREDPLYLDYVWRIMLGFGIVPCVATVYFRLTMPETPRFSAHVKGDHEAAQRDIQKLTHPEAQTGKGDDITVNQPLQPVEPVPTERKVNFQQYFSQPKNAKLLFATAYCWFALDIAWYGLSLNLPVVLELIDYSGHGGDQYDSFWAKAVGNIIVACMGTVPGYWVTVALIEKLGRKPIQYVGFSVITIILAILAGAWDQILKKGDDGHYTSSSKAIFLTLYTIAQFFFNFGPNETTFIYPAEIFPTRFRSRAHGLSSAAGKCGAIVGIQAVGPFFFDHPKIVLAVFAAVMASGFFTTFLLPEPKGKTLEELTDTHDDSVPEDEVMKIEV
ncbi:phosphate:H+ symporter [Spizellomyces punctatus DAOM BR117]|uniref:Phosphate:H+ symporter n=2 Tax=Spizellomyces punctatus TaxID=109760 RepID=A0A0L0HK47_SPIPD|nr:phosphate:H+ symporter, variant [Spizellomyces punctatus DAOM BR117]XP_016609300.1 phosphate:H+ symporter [Spizellomyces punctatus DAOM BR117]KND01260.1 phosphate:H+ symporter, variant [Spizellomyces punctatus DAOM BR117]KND01261.1 phosphate:H+ symporter [Spizellomyces punctatus DAOM BR117]|eukprot:XP_016609299.1 phosphate:H+ symporter, variant [Spizellomyces punctatus DAOM BR117]